MINFFRKLRDKSSDDIVDCPTIDENDSKNNTLNNISLKEM